MKVTAWRIFKPKFASTAFTGDGARLFAGRWNNKGVAVVYTASSISLAALESLVHLLSAEILSAYQMCSVVFEDSLVEYLDPATLPPDWQLDPPPAGARSIGDSWAHQMRSAVLQVPSVIVPEENNYLLNPAHPDFKKVAIGTPEPFQFDPRLIK